MTPDRDDKPASTLALGETLQGGPVTRIDASRGEDVDSTGMAAAESREPRYEQHGVLGAGGMGEVELCLDRRIGRYVAFKRLHREQATNATLIRRFMREARVQGQLEHPSIVPLYDLGEASASEQYFTMRRVQGSTLLEVLESLRRGDAETAARFTRRRLLTAFTSVCMAVHYAHSRGVIHRDLKPANVMLGEFGEVYVLDWGVAKLVSREPERETVSAADSEDTLEGAMMGTPGYMAPEQLKGEHATLDARADVYALGVILFEILTHRRLHENAPFGDIVVKTLEGLDVLPSSRSSDVPPELDLAFQRSTALAPEDRFSSARDLADAIERYLDGDRDVERRQALARGFVAQARAMLQRALETADASAAESLRSDALRDVVRALALDADHADARKLLVQLMVQAPDTLPPEAAAEMEAATAAVRREGARLGFRGMLAWLATAPLLLVLGIRSTLLPLAGTVLIAAGAAYSWYLSRRDSISRSEGLVLVLTLGAVVSMFASWLGPFVLVPVAGATVTLLVIMHSTRRERPIVIAIGVLSVILPVVVEFLHIAPPAFTIEPGRLVLHERVVVLNPHWTIAALTYGNFSFAVLPAMLVGRLRDALSIAERRLFLQAWQLRRVAAA